MSCMRFLMLVMAFAATTWSNCQAAGSYQTKPPFPKEVVTAGIAPTVTVPNISARDLVGGCGCLIECRFGRLAVEIDRIQGLGDDRRDLGPFRVRRQRSRLVDQLPGMPNFAPERQAAKETS